MTWRITPLLLYRFATPGPEVLFQRGFGETIELAIHAFLLEGPATVLVDTGLPDDYAALTTAMRSRKGPAAGFAPAGAPLAERLTGPVDAVVVTSFGPYAAGGLPRLPHVTVHASARGLADLAATEEPGFSHPLPPPVRDRLGTATPVAGEASPYPGLVIVETGSHHPASATVIVDTADGRIAIADPIFCRRNLVEGIALGAAEDARAWYAEARLLAQRVDAVIPIHDLQPAPVPLDAWHAVLKH